MPELRVIKSLAFTALALIAFAANSVLCKLALGGKTIDAAGFTSVRLLSGALVLFCILYFSNKKTRSSAKGSWSAACMLFLYAVTFSFAYLTLSTGTGALILFGSVQITMILRSLFSGTRLILIEWVGVVVAFSGIVYLVSVPVIAGFGGVVFVSEQISLRLTLSALLTLGGILMVILGRNAAPSKSVPK